MDERPTKESVLAYSQVLLAEAETLRLVGGEKRGSAMKEDQPKVKMMQSTNGKGGSTTTNGSNVCRHWGTTDGCRFTKSCRYEHPQLYLTETKDASCAVRCNIRKLNVPFVELRCRLRQGGVRRQRKRQEKRKGTG